MAADLVPFRPVLTEVTRLPHRHRRVDAQHGQDLGIPPLAVALDGTQLDTHRWSLTSGDPQGRQPLRRERPLAELGPGASEPQPTTVSHDGGSADRAGARVPRCTPASPSHAVRPSTRASPAGGSACVAPCAMASSSRRNLGGDSPAAVRRRCAVPFACHILRGTTGNSGTLPRMRPRLPHRSAAGHRCNRGQETRASQAEGSCIVVTDRSTRLALVDAWQRG